MKTRGEIEVASLSGKAIDEGAKKMIVRVAPAGVDAFVETLIQSKGDGKDVTWDAAFHLARAAATAAQLRGGANFSDIDFSKLPTSARSASS